MKTANILDDDLLDQWRAWDDTARAKQVEHLNKLTAMHHANQDGAQAARTARLAAELHKSVPAAKPAMPMPTGSVKDTRIPMPKSRMAAPPPRVTARPAVRAGSTRSIAPVLAALGIGALGVGGLSAVAGAGLQRHFAGNADDVKTAALRDAHALFGLPL